MISLGSKLRRRLLAYCFTNPGAEHYVRELARLLSVDSSNLSRELTRLERQGLFSTRMRGREKYYRLNPSYPLYREVRGIVLKTIGADAQLRNALGKVPGVEEAFLFGSFAANQQDASSDIDVMVIGTPEPAELESHIRDLERLLGREINYTILSRREFERRRKRKDAFLTGVLSGKRVSLVA